ncbi:MAG TPA: sigma-54 dependent transcriptional regulator [Acidobacteriota bacterium]|nr:sigma-54 dependent transcriptional regulator [Acidobacteriota bacterium]
MTDGGQRPKGRVLVIDDERSVCISCQRILEEEGYAVEYALSGVEGIERAKRQNWDLILLDLIMPDLPGMEALAQIHAERPDQTVVIITGYATIQTSIEAIKQGAFDYIPKPFTPEELALSVSKALDDRRLRSENEYLKQELYRVRSESPIVSRSKVMGEILNQIRKVAPSEFTVMIYGESGTGKELMAHAIHENSARRERPFVAVDVSAVTPTLVESELFGHVKGAFTGAVRSRPGYFIIADGGSLFLDEIANINYDLQGKLLRVLENKRVRPVGSDDERRIDIRLIVATNRDLFRLCREGKFREDLYYRLNVIPLTVPPLRDRSDDIPLLAKHFLEKARGKSDTRIRGFTTEAMAKLIAYEWPGNVRELKNLIERLVGTVETDLVRIEHLPPKISGVLTVTPDTGIGQAPESIRELKLSKRRLKERVYEQVDRAFIFNALDRTGWNITHAAAFVGMQRTNFHALMRKYGIRRGE